ncbi:hypothetical protein MF271_22165 (plasmid) [Deinococcus sp. KNUC1210]|uniref:hypothetical protein n=1 Tax=Deinococcus sp. KNUC1210 TaxID=2917691 RepID=UPI001EF0739F|nr:hypothetical protein [Deinococcus sp. KNUC1210]ULH18182.1 hypothetical protein MF271_22165 [Deinococcus sp. KNUC1210]
MTMMNSGVMVTANGTINVVRNARKSGSRPQKRKRAKAYPAMELITSWPRVVRTATNSELKRTRQIGKLLAIS